MLTPKEAGREAASKINRRDYPEGEKGGAAYHKAYHKAYGKIYNKQYQKKHGAYPNTVYLRGFRDEAKRTVGLSELERMLKEAVQEAAVPMIVLQRPSVDLRCCDVSQGGSSARNIENTISDVAGQEVPLDLSATSKVSTILNSADALSMENTISDVAGQKVPLDLSTPKASTILNSAVCDNAITPKTCQSSLVMRESVV